MHNFIAPLQYPQQVIIVISVSKRVNGSSERFKGLTMACNKKLRKSGLKPRSAFYTFIHSLNVCLALLYARSYSQAYETCSQRPEFNMLALDARNVALKKNRQKSLPRELIIEFHNCEYHYCP